MDQFDDLTDIVEKDTKPKFQPEICNNSNLNQQVSNLFVPLFGDDPQEANVSDSGKQDGPGALPVGADSSPAELTVSADSSLAELRAFIDQHGLQVSKGIGGTKSRTKEQIFANVASDAIAKVHGQGS